jgi:hypothetical protein
MLGYGTAVGAGEGVGEGDGIVNVVVGTAVLSGGVSFSCLPPLQATRLAIDRANTRTLKEIDR